MNKDIFDFVIEQESAFKLPVEPMEGWSWNMPAHIRKSVLYKNSQFEEENENRTKRPFKNIIRTILNVQYRLEGFDVKDIEIYVNNPKSYYKSFLIKKFHDKWALENKIDTFIDEVVESYVDFGGVLVKKVKGARPEVVKLQTLAFADQTDILSGAFGIKHYFTLDGLRKMKGVWDNDAIDMAILKSEASKQQSKDQNKSKTTSKYVEVYEIHGEFPAEWAGGEEGEYTRQIHIISFYEDENGNKNGLSLFAKKEPTLPFKFLSRDPIFGRALGFGGVEELFEPQKWTNYSEIRVAEILDACSKVLHITDDPAFKNKNKIANMENNEVLLVQQGRTFRQMDTVPRNMPVFDNALVKWEDHARQLGAVSDLFFGEQPVSGTPFKSVEVQVAENKSLHAYRQGKIAVFMDEIYRDWIIPQIANEVSKEQYFLSELSSEEFQFVADSLVKCETNKYIVEQILDGQLIDPEQVQIQEQKIREDFIRGGSKKFIQILKGEMTDEPLDVMTNIAGKQKNLAHLTDKVVNVLRQFIASPEIRQDPEMVKLLNVILESSGLSPVTFSPRAYAAPQETQGGSTEPLKALGASVKEMAGAVV